MTAHFLPSDAVPPRRRVQFIVFWLLGAIGGVAYLLAVARYPGWLLAPAAGGCLFAAWKGRPRSLSLLFPWGIAVLIAQALLLVCPWMWHGLGESNILCHWTCICLPLAVTISVLCLLRRHWAALFVSVATALPLLSVQLRFTCSAWRVWEEMSAMSAYAQDWRGRFDTYPLDASRYKYKHDDLRELVEYWSDDAGETYVVTGRLYDGDDVSWELSRRGWTYHDD
jgi:hypothetical protein